MTDIEEVTEMDMQTLRDVRGGTIKRELAETIFNGTGKVIAAYKLRLAYETLKMLKPGTIRIAGLEAEKLLESPPKAARKLASA
jgi:hypothetical protein